MDAFRFILENPHPNAPNNKQRKRARLVTACDSCRVKKIKCQQPTPNGCCEACKIAKTPCLFGDRDRYQAQRGVACAWNPPVEEVADSTETSSKKRKMGPISYPAPSSPPPQRWTSTSSSSSTERSLTVTPAEDNVTVSNYRYFHPEHAGPSFTTEFNDIPHSTARTQDTNVTPASYDQLPLFDPNRPRFPHPYRMRHLGGMFFDHVGVHFPFLDRFDVLHRIEQRTCSAILSNCIAGLAVRFANHSQPELADSSVFYEMAKTLVANVVSVPSVETLHALICIAWAEYGAGNDDGFQMYSRMAIAMCLDLGLGHEATIQVAATPAVRHRLRITWWIVVCTADIAASWATGRPATLDIHQFDTSLPEATDDLSLLFRNISELIVLRGKLDRVLVAHVDNLGDNSLDWDLSELQRALMNIFKGLPSTMMFNEENLARMHDQRAGHFFVHMHILIHAVSALIHRPSLLPAYGLPVPMEGPRVEAAHTCAKSLADILTTVENVAPQTLCDPFMNLSILVACRIFIAESDAQASLGVSRTSGSRLLLSQCKRSLVRLSATWGGVVTFDNVMEQHWGTHADDLEPPVFSSIDLFTVPPKNNHQYLHPNFFDDGASDSSGSFRSSSRELSPRIGAAPGAVLKHPPFIAGGSPLVREVDDSGVELNERDLSFRTSEFFMSGSSEDGYGGEFFDEPCGLQLSMMEGHQWGDDDLWPRKDMSLGEKPLRSNMSSVTWLTQR